MSSPQEKHYEAVKAELAADDAHPMSGTVIDEIIALKASGQHVAAEATREAARVDFREWFENARMLAGGEL